MEPKKPQIEITLSQKEHDYYDLVFTTVATTEPEGKVSPPAKRTKRW